MFLHLVLNPVLSRFQLKNATANLTDFDKNRSITISSLLSKLLYYVIIKPKNILFKSSDYQFGFKPEFTSILSTTMVTKTIQYYSENECKHVHLLLLDAKKAFDKVAYDMLFKVLIQNNIYIYIFIFVHL